MPIEKLVPSFTFTEDRLAELQSVVPEAFADGKINWEALREALGDYVEDEGQDTEHFGLSWPGKREARRLATQPSKGTLRPAKGEGINEEITSNVFIEGDNLEVLKILQKSYADRIKMIYIDPPYNTGNDFVYKDDFREPLDNYLRTTGQMDEHGNVLTSNPRAGGRFHSNWLNMIYPRLVLSRTLLQEDGMIFVSIDDNEVHNLRLVMNDIFGEENYVDTIVWKKRYGGGAKEKYLVTVHEYVVIYARSIVALPSLFVASDPAAVARYYKSRDEKYEVRGPYRTHPLEATKSMGDRKNLVYGIPGPDSRDIWPRRQWLWSKERAMSALTNNELEFVQGREGWTVHTKQYLRDEEGTVRSSKMFTVIDNVFSQHGTNEILEIFGDARIFSFPKPTGLLMSLLQVGTSTSGSETVLDFFAGSASMAHAMMLLNRKDGGKRKYICVQLPEPNPGSEFSTIAEIGKERIRRVIKRIEEGAESELDLQDPDNPNDLGFKVFKLDRSNYKAWQDYQGEDLGALATLFDSIEMPLIDGFNRADLLTEIVLLQGYPLDSTIMSQDMFEQNEVLRVTSDAFSHDLYVCLDDKIYEDTIKALVHLRSVDIFVCLDAALSDEAKMRLSDVCNLKVI